MKTIQTDLTVIAKFSAEKAYLILVITGRWTGMVVGLLLVWCTKECWEGLAFVLDSQAIPGVCTALTALLTFTMLESIVDPFLALYLAELECIWTGQLVLCPSIVCPPLVH